MCLDAVVARNRKVGGRLGVDKERVERVERVDKERVERYSAWSSVVVLIPSPELWEKFRVRTQQHQGDVAL